MIKKFIQSKFVRNVGVVTIGTAGVQAITILFTLIITRLYGPEAFGLLGVFGALVAIFSPIAALTYPMAIVLPKQDPDAKALGWLSFYIALSMSIFFAFVILIWGDALLSLVGSSVITTYAMLIPLTMFSAAILQIAQQWLIRKKQFKIIAKVSVYQAFIVDSAKTGLGLINPIAPILIVVWVVGSILHAIMLWVGVRKAQNQDETTQKKTSRHTFAHIKNVAVEHKDFLFYRFPQTTIDNISLFFPTLLLATFFGPAAAGFYTLAKAVLSVPIRLIGTSVNDVFYPTIVQTINEKKDIEKKLFLATAGLVLIGLVPFALLIITGPVLFEIVFGKEWYRAGEYASWLALWLFTIFINRPTIAAIPALSMQKVYLNLTVFMVAARVLALYFGLVIYNDDLMAVALFAIVSTFVNFGVMLAVFWKAKKYKIFV